MLNLRNKKNHDNCFSSWFFFDAAGCWLKVELEKQGQKVIAPQFSVDKWADVGELNPADYYPDADLSN